MRLSKLLRMVAVGGKEKVHRGAVLNLLGERGRGAKDGNRARAGCVLKLGSEGGEDGLEVGRSSDVEFSCRALGQRAQCMPPKWECKGEEKAAR